MQIKQLIAAVLISLWIVIIRRLNHLRKYKGGSSTSQEVFENVSDESHRNSWTIFTDIMIQVMQVRRDNVVSSLESIKSTRKKIDGLFLPVDRRKLELKQVFITAKSGHSMKGEWIIPKNEADPKKAILYFHGGGFCLCSINTHRKLASQIALASRTRLFIFEYRRTPEFVYPAQIEDGIDAFNYVISQGHKPKNIAFCGDSAGAHLAVSVPLHLIRRDNKGEESLPGAVGVMSPWVDLTSTSESFQKNFDYDFLPSFEKMNGQSRFYSPNISLNDWRISPVFGDFTGFPSLYIQASQHEQLVDDSILLEKNARLSGTSVKLETWKHQPHVFQAFGGKAASEATTKMGEWIRQQLEFNSDYDQPSIPKEKGKFRKSFDEMSRDILKASLSLESKHSNMENL